MCDLGVECKLCVLGTLVERETHGAVDMVTPSNLCGGGLRLENLDTEGGPLVGLLLDGVCDTCTAIGSMWTPLLWLTGGLPRPCVYLPRPADGEGLGPREPGAS